MPPRLPKSCACATTRRRVPTSFSIKPKGMAGIGSRRKTKLETFLIFNQQFLTLIRAGLPILGSLDMLAKSQKNPTFAAQLENVTERVRQGESISAAFEAQGGIPVVYTVTLLAGERSGNLDEVLTRYLAFQRISLTFRKKLTASLIYPTLLIVLVMALFIFLITFVVPQFATLYNQVGTKLPGITLDLLAFGKFAQHYFFYVAPAVAHRSGLPALPLEQAPPAAAMCIDGVRIKLPIFGQHLAQVPGRAFLANTLDAAYRRSAAGSLARDRGALHLVLAYLQEACSPPSPASAKERASPAASTVPASSLLSQRK